MTGFPSVPLFVWISYGNHNTNLSQNIMKRVLDAKWALHK